MFGVDENLLPVRYGKKQQHGSDKVFHSPGYLKPIKLVGDNLCSPFCVNVSDNRLLWQLNCWSKTQN